MRRKFVGSNKRQWKRVAGKVHLKNKVRKRGAGHGRL